MNENSESKFLFRVIGETQISLERLKPEGSIPGGGKKGSVRGDLWTDILWTYTYWSTYYVPNTALVPRIWSQKVHLVPECVEVGMHYESCTWNISRVDHEKQFGERRYPTRDWSL